MVNPSNSLDQVALEPTLDPVDPSRDSWQRFGDILVGIGKIGARDLDRAMAAQREMGGSLDRVLVSLGLVSELDASRALAEHLKLPFVTADAFPESLPEPDGLLPDFLKTHHVLPLRVESGQLDVAMAAPQDEFVLKALRLTTGLVVRPAVGLPSDIDKALSRFLDEPSSDPEQAEAGDFDTDAGDFVEHLRDLASEAPVIRLVNTIIGRVIELRASDIHLEPFDDGLHVRYRVDGVLHPGEVVPSQQGAAVSSRVKLLAHLDIAERRLPQDGRIKTRVKGRELDLRVSTVPTVHGESVVMRVLDRASVRFSLEDMGFEKDTLARFNQLVHRPHGILLVTGPTGSGKTTTLYAALSEINHGRDKIITIEDPVEYQLPGILQIPVNDKKGLTFARGLRSILRHDPDKIMVGEIRDKETAEIAVQSALTGHLVLSTVHANNVYDVFGRFHHIGVDLYSFVSALNGVTAQRLVRLNCPHCAVPYRPTDEELVDAGLTAKAVKGYNFMRGRGCGDCRGSGYRGRKAVAEVLTMNPEIAELIVERRSVRQIVEAAQRNGTRSLYEDALSLVATGETTLEEVRRVTLAA